MAASKDPVRKRTHEEVLADLRDNIPADDDVLGNEAKMSDADVRAAAKDAAKRADEEHAATVDEKRDNVQRARAEQKRAADGKATPTRTTDPSGEGPQTGHPDVVNANTAHDVETKGRTGKK